MRPAVTGLGAVHKFIKPQLPLAERESGAVQPHPADRMGLPPDLRQQRRADGSPCTWLEFYNTRRDTQHPAVSRRSVECHQRGDPVQPSPVATPTWLCWMFKCPKRLPRRSRLGDSVEYDLRHGPVATVGIGQYRRAAWCSLAQRARWYPAGDRNARPGRFRQRPNRLGESLGLGDWTHCALSLGHRAYRRG